MKDRFITAAGAVIALMVLYTVFFQRIEPPVTRPVSTESGRNGYAAVTRWLESAGYRIISLRERYDSLIELAPANPLELPRSGNLLITTMPHLLPVRSREHDSLKAWIRSGNSLLILAALHDSPEWTPPNTSREFLQDLQIMTGVVFQPSDRPQGSIARRRAPIEAGSTIELDPVQGHPLTEGVSSLRGYSDSESTLWRPILPEAQSMLLLTLASERSSGLDAVWERRLGNGHIIVVSSGTLLTNHVVADSDAGRFLANIMHHHVRGNGAVIFDDMHQGLSLIYDADAFYGDPRLHRSLWFLIVAWLVYVLGSSNRLGPAPTARPAGPRQRDFLEAVGGFMARRLDARDAGMTLMEAWFADVKQARGLRDDGPPWNALRSTPTLDRETFERLRRYHDALAAGKAVNLVRLHNTLRKAREAIG